MTEKALRLGGFFNLMNGLMDRFVILFLAMTYRDFVFLLEIKKRPRRGRLLERAKGVEPSYSAWKAAALPLCYARTFKTKRANARFLKVVERGGFEPPYSEEGRFTVCCH